MNGTLLGLIDAIEREKGIARESLMQAVEAGLLSAARKRAGASQDMVVRIDRQTGEVKMFVKKVVSANVTSPKQEISLEEACKLNPDAKFGDTCEIEVPSREFGRIAAQNARQIIIQRIRDAERDIIYEGFKKLQGTIVTGNIHRFEASDVIVDLGKLEGILIRKEQIPRERYHQGQMCRFYLLDVKRSGRGPQAILSRTHPNFLRKLFEMEVEEVADGIVEMKSVAREAGDRAKIAVFSKMDNVDCVGACIGVKGSRIKTVMRDLAGEKIDIIRWSDDMEEYLCNALSPAKVKKVVLNIEDKSAVVLVEKDQLSLAIGKKGQNVRLTSKLTGWKIDIRTEKEAMEEDITTLPGISKKVINALQARGLKTIGDLKSSPIEEILRIKGIGKMTLKKIMDALEVKKAKRENIEELQKAGSNAGEGSTEK